MKKQILLVMAIFAALIMISCGEDDDSKEETGDSEKVVSDETGDLDMAESDESLDTQEDVDSESITLEISGKYSDGYGAHEISDENWKQIYGEAVILFNIKSFDNDVKYLVAQSDESNDGDFAGKFNKFEWIVKDEALYFCNSVFDAETEEAAENAKALDRTDPENGGCGDYPWTKLSKVEE